MSCKHECVVSDRVGRILRWLLPSLLACLLACEGDGPPATAAPGAPAGRIDAGRLEDPPRTATLADAAASDHAVLSEDGKTLCGYDDEDAYVFPGNASFGEVALANDGRGFALIHHDADGALFIEAFPVGERALEPVRLLNAQDTPGAVALAAVAQRFVMLWRSDAQLLARNLDTASGSAPAVLSTTLDTLDSGGEPFALTAQADHFVAAFSAQGILHVQQLAADGAVQGASGELTPDAPALDVQLAPLDNGRTLLAWHERDESGVGKVMAQVLDAALDAVGAPVEVNRSPSAEARFDLDARALSAGVLFHAREGGVRDSVKYRRIDADGQPSQPVLNIVNAPGRARDGAIAAFGQGYAVAYRALPSLGVDRTTLRIAFIDQFGRIVHDAELAETTENGGRTSISATADSELMVAWTTEWPAGPQTHTLALDCPGALRLCGGSIK